MKISASAILTALLSASRAFSSSLRGNDNSAIGPNVVKSNVDLNQVSELSAGEAISSSLKENDNSVIDLDMINLNQVDDDKGVRGTNRPSLSPTEKPLSFPSSQPSSIPSSYPSPFPTSPSSSPSSQPSNLPSNNQTTNHNDDDKNNNNDDKKNVVCIFPNGTIVYSKDDVVESNEALKTMEWFDASRLSEVSYYNSVINSNVTQGNDTGIGGNNSTGNSTIPLCPSTTVKIEQGKESDIDIKYYALFGGIALAGCCVAVAACACCSKLKNESRSNYVSPTEDSVFL